MNLPWGQPGDRLWLGTGQYEKGIISEVVSGFEQFCASMAGIIDSMNLD
jgi:hypothetical protein